MLLTRTIVTQDRAGWIADRGFHAPEKVGRTRRMTPEGYLVLEGTPIARTGEQIYASHELPGLTPDGSGQIIVTRLPEEVFSEKTIQSFEGKDFVIEHPADGVDSNNWRKHTVGHIQNVRRGTGIEDDLLLADIMVKDPVAVEYINKYLPQISAGYQADYTETAPGRAVQRNILGNHAAAVTAGRAGARVAIRDSIGALMHTRDARLDALPAKKAIPTGLTWTGNLEPDLDSHVDNLANWVTPFSAGHVLTAEPVPDVMQLGLVYTGALMKEHIAQGDTSLMPLSRAMDQLVAATKGNLPRVSAIEDGIRSVRAARDARRKQADSKTADGQTLARNAIIGSMQAAKDTNANNRAFYATKDTSRPAVPRTVSPSGPRLASDTLARWRGNASSDARQINIANRAYYRQENPPSYDWQNAMTKK